MEREPKDTIAGSNADCVRAVDVDCRDIDETWGEMRTRLTSKGGIGAQKRSELIASDKQLGGWLP